MNLESGMKNLAKIELGCSIFYFIQGIIGSGHASHTNDVAGYRGVCISNITAGLIGIGTTAIVLWAFDRYPRSRMIGLYIFGNILSAIAFLLVVVFSGIWLGRVHHYYATWTKSLTIFMLVLAAVLGQFFDRFDEVIRSDHQNFVFRFLFHYQFGTSMRPMRRRSTEEEA